MFAVLESTLDLFYPKFCFGCQREGSWLCSDCQAALPKIFKKPPPPLSRLLIVSKYTSPLKEMICTFKYQDGWALKKILGQLLDKRLKQFNVKGFYLTAIPLHKDKQAQRGFNQAELLVSELAPKTGLPAINGLVRVRNTPPQAEIKDKGRRLQNIKKGFSFGGRLRGEKIILIDDVATTGATLSEAARVLKRAGAKEIVGLVLAHG